MRGKGELERTKQHSLQQLEFTVYELVVTQFYAGCLYENSVLSKDIYDSTEYKENTAAW